MSKSEIEREVYKHMRELFPLETIEKEYYINYNGTRLFFDMFLKGMGILVECQGQQHYTFNKHFHGTIERFRAQKSRDNLKVSYMQDNPRLSLVYFYDRQDKITAALVRKRIAQAQKKVW